MRDSVPSVRYPSICNVLHLWRISEVISLYAHTQTHVSEAFIKRIKIIVLTPHEYYMLLPALIISADFEPMVRPSVQSRRFMQYNMSNRGMCCFKGQRAHAAGCFKDQRCKYPGDISALSIDALLS